MLVIIKNVIRELKLKDVYSVGTLLMSSFYKDVRKRGLTLFQLIVSLKLSLIFFKIFSFLKLVPISRFDFVYEKNSKVIGYIRADNITLGNKEWYISNVVVERKYRGRGIGTNLLNFMVSKLKTMKIRRISLRVNVKNESAIRLYKKCKFQIHFSEYCMAREFSNIPIMISFVNLFKNGLLYGTFLFLIMFFRRIILREKIYMIRLKQKEQEVSFKIIKIIKGKIVVFSFASEKKTFKRLGFKPLEKYYRMVFVNE